jgi:hypothetical protein
MLLAQSLGEYGGVRDVLEGLLRAFNTAWDAVRDAEPKTWVMVGAAALVVWLVLRR